MALTSIRGGQRVTAGLLVVGSLVGLIGNALHPHVAAGDPTAALGAMASNGAWIPIHLGIIVAILLVVGGLVGLGRELEGDMGAPMARLGVAAALVGGGLVTVSTTMDGLTMRSLAQQVVSEGSPATLQLAITVQSVGFGIWSIGMLVFFGGAFACFGLALLATPGYPARYGWVALVGGAGSALAALLQIWLGEVQEAETVFLISSVLLTLWTLAVGIRVWRTAGHASPAAAPGLSAPVQG